MHDSEIQCKLRAAWAAAPPAPDLRDYLPNLNAGDVAALMAVDVRARRVRSMPATLDVYLAANPDLFAPDTDPAVSVIYHELAKNYNDPKTAAKELRNRYGRRYRSTIDKALSIWGEERRHVANQTAPMAQECDDVLPDRIGNYRVLRVIGRGGMGVVYEATQDAPARQVAIKLVRLSGADPMAARRFTKEMETLARIEHPNVARIYDAGTAMIHGEEQPYFVMELVDGVPLDHYLADRDLPLRRVIELLVDLCKAVHHAHQRGVIHRDVKPANILVSSEGKPVILDFGIARLADENVDATMIEAEVGQIVGTIPFMAPEQTYGDPHRIDLRVDVYALGVLAYQGLANKHPHDLRNKAILELVRTIREDAATPLTQVMPQIPADVATIIHKAMAKDPERRYQSASELAADLTRYLENQPIAARPPSAWYHVRKFTQRNRALVGAALLAVLALVGGIASTTIGFIRAKQAEDRAVTAGQATEHQRKKTQELADQLAAKLYASTIQQAQLEIINGNFDNSRELLDGCQPQFRDWEWRYLQHATEPLHRRLLPREQASHFAVSSDQKRLAAIADNNIVRIVDVDNSSTRQRLVVDGKPRRLAFSRNGNVLFVSYLDGSLNAWRLADQTKLWTRPGIATHAEIQLTANGEGIVSAGRDPRGLPEKGNLFVTNATNGELLAAVGVPQSVPRHLAVLADGRILAATDKRLYYCKMAASEQAVEPAEDFANAIDCLAAAREAPFYAVASRSGIVTVVNSESGQVVLQRSFPAPVVSLALSKDGSKLAAGAYSGILTQPINSSDDAYRPRGIEAGCKPISFLNNAETIVTCDQEGLVIAPDSRYTAASTITGHKKPLNAIRFSRDGKRMGTTASGPRSLSGDGVVRLWEPSSYRPIAALTGHAGVGPLRAGGWDLAFRPTSPEMASVGRDRTLKLWNLNTDSLIRSVGRSWDKGPPGENPIAVPKNLHGDFTALVSSVDYHPGGKELATGTENGDISIWRADGTPLKNLRGHFNRVYGAAYHPVDNTFVVCSRKSVTVYDARNQKRIKTIVPFRRQNDWSLPDHYVNAVSFSADGKILAMVVSARNDRIVCLYSWPEATLLKELSLAAPAVYALKFNPHDNRLLVGGGLGFAEVWDADTGKRLHELRGHSDHVVNVAWNPANPEQCATAGFDGRLIQWNAETGAILSTRSGPSPLDVTYSPDGTILAASHRTRVVFYDPDNGEERRVAYESKSNARRIAFSADGKRLAVGCDDGSLADLNLATGSVRFTRQDHREQIKGVAYSPSGDQLIASSNDGRFTVVNAVDGTLIFQDAPDGAAIDCVRYSPSGLLLVSTGRDGRTIIWETDTYQQIAAWQRHAALATNLALSRDGSLLATTGASKMVLADFPSGAVRHEISYGAMVTAGPAISPSGTRVAIADADRRIRVFSTQSGQEVLRTALDTHLWSLAFSPDGRDLIGGDVNGNLRIFEGSAK